MIHGSHCLPLPSTAPAPGLEREQLLAQRPALRREHDADPQVHDPHPGRRAGARASSHAPHTSAEEARARGRFLGQFLVAAVAVERRRRTRTRTPSAAVRRQGRDRARRCAASDRCGFRGSRCFFAAFQRPSATLSPARWITASTPSSIEGSSGACGFQRDPLRAVVVGGGSLPATADEPNDLVPAGGEERHEVGADQPA